MRAYQSWTQLTGLRTDTFEEVMEKGKNRNIHFLSLHADFTHDFTQNLAILPVAGLQRACMINFLFN